MDGYHSNPKHLIQLEYQDPGYVQSSFPAHYNSYPDNSASQQMQPNHFVENISEQYKLLKHNVQSRIKTLQNNMRQADSIKTKNSLNNEATSQYLHNINTNKKGEKTNIPYSIYKNNSFMFEECESRNQNQQIRSRTSVQRDMHHCVRSHCCSHHFHCCRPLHCNGEHIHEARQEKTNVVEREIRKLMAQQKYLKEETRKKLGNQINDNMSYPSNNSSNTINLNEVMYENLQTQKQINRNLLLLNNKLLKYNEKGSLSIEQGRKEQKKEKQNQNQNQKQKFDNPFALGEDKFQHNQYIDEKQDRRRLEKNFYSRHSRKYESSDQEGQQDEESYQINQNQREYLNREQAKIYKNGSQTKKKYQLMKPHNLDRNFPNVSNYTQNNSKSISANKIQVKKKQKQLNERGEKQDSKQRKIQMAKIRDKKKSLSSKYLSNKNNRSESKNKTKKKPNQYIQSEYYNQNVGPKGLNINIKVKQQKPSRRLSGNCHLKHNQILNIYEIKLQRKKSRSNKNQVYKDSKHRNLKHERQHMLNALQQQDKLRNVIVQKMCKQFYNSFREK